MAGAMGESVLVLVPLRQSAEEIPYLPYRSYHSGVAIGEY